MKAIIRAKAEEIFRNQLSINYYNELKKNSDIYEYGIDIAGNVYFAYLNGIISRFTKKEFLKEAKEFYSEENQEFLREQSKYF